MSDFPMLLAVEMGVTRRTVTRWCEAGEVPGAYRTKGGSLAAPKTGANKEVVEVPRQNCRLRLALHLWKWLQAADP
jgi:hypothetical protein